MDYPQSPETPCQALKGVAASFQMKTMPPLSGLDRLTKDAGADGIIIPMIRTIDDVKKAVNHTYYPPFGERGVGLARAQSYGLNFENYKNRINDDVKLILQIEHIDAVNNIDEIFKDHTFETIVLTSKQQEIIWVNDGFKKMTGYSKNFAINKTPSFLQGAETCEKTKQRIRKKLQSNKPFTDLVINYKKDQTTYECEITVFPLHNKDTTHYIALEKAV